MHGWSTCTYGRLQTQLARYMPHANQAKCAKDRQQIDRSMDLLGEPGAGASGAPGPIL